jgi:hypothetical protein
MKTTKHLFFCLLICSFLTVSCNRQEQDNLSVTKGYWGHLTELDSIATSGPTKLYLSHLKKNETYEICMPNFMENKYPGIKEETKAAINIWAHYIGRKINVNIQMVNVSEPEASQSEENVMNELYSKCPKGIDLVMGESYFRDSAVGKTIPKYSYTIQNGKKKLVSFQRALFLRATEKNEDGTIESSNDYSNVKWISLSQSLGTQNLSEKEILEIMLKRNKNIYLSNPGELLTFKTIVHEFGHVWGMCDQYPLANNKTNCDPRFSTLDNEGHIFLHDESTMSKSSWIAPIYLSDDDIEGVRRIGERPEFKHDWPMKLEFRNIPVDSIAKKEAIPVAKIHRAIFDKDVLNTELALLTNVSPITMKIRVFDKSINNWIKFGDSVLNSTVQTNNYTLKLNFSRYVEPSKVELTLKAEQTNIVLESEVINNHQID